MLELRARQRRNFIATLMLSEGVPLLLGGDEFARSQDGNNNAYCQDNELTWFDWKAVAAEHRPGASSPPACVACANSTRCSGAASSAPALPPTRAVATTSTGTAQTAC